MGECARCGDFTDNPADGKYQYCDDFLGRFDEVHRRGVVVQEKSGENSYEVSVNSSGSTYEGGIEDNQVDALARGKYLVEQTGETGLFEYRKTGSQWILEEYLREHPQIRSDVDDRLSRVPQKADSGLLQKLKSLF